MFVHGFSHGAKPGRTAPAVSAGPLLPSPADTDQALRTSTLSALNGAPDPLFFLRTGTNPPVLTVAGRQPYVDNN